MSKKSNQSSVSNNASSQRVADSDFDKAFEFLDRLFDLKEADARHPVRSNSVYTTSVVLWMLIYQRMNPDSTLETAVKKLTKTKPELLPNNKRVTDNTLSTNTSSYSHARSRVSTDAVSWFSDYVARSIIDTTEPSFEGRRVFLIDGTTIKLAPEPELQKAYPPAENQYGNGVWPIALLTVAHELSSGVAVNPAIGPMYGENAISETRLASQLFEQMPEKSVVMGDSGFGIYSVAHRAAAAGHDFVFRMMKSRFDSLRKKATEVKRGNGYRTYSCTWQPTAKERKTNPDLPPKAFQQVFLHEIEIHENFTLMLVTSLPTPALKLKNLYERRYDVEVDIRNLKIVLDVENIRARSLTMFNKELHASVISYNLVGQFRRQAAELVGRNPRGMSFKRTWTTFRTFLLYEMHTDARSWREQYEIALKYAMADKLPNRPGRKFEREVYPKRPKSNQFKKRKRRKET